MLDQKPGKDRKNTETEGRKDKSPNQDSGGDRSNGASPFAQPTISLPRGGGAIRGLGEKFAANPVTGTGSMTVPIAVSSGRSGFGPQVSLSYDSGANNGPFGLGWNLSLPAITRKTDKGLPRYQDSEESDVFLLSGAEDLVPVLNPDGSRFEDDTTFPQYKIRRYRPRVEGLFARIERWTHKQTGETHWRSITKDNHTTLYGKTEETRIFDPEDPLRVFTWLICESYDDKGNAILYEYKPEDSIGVDLAQVNERNRTETSRRANRYLKHIKYCNQTPRTAGEDLAHRDDWLMEVVFDYGEHDADNPKPDDAGLWTVRTDAFSSYRSGFEVRTYRLCRRVLMFHHFNGEAGVGQDCLVRSTDFDYSANHIASFISSVTQSGYKRDGNGYLKRSLPPVEFAYSKAVILEKVEELDADSLDNLPAGLDGSAYQWVDLDGEGISGILTEQAGAWFFKRNLSPIHPHPENPQQVSAKFAPVELVAVKPNAATAGGQAQFMDLAGDGQPDLVILNGSTPGFYEHDEAAGWKPFRPFEARLNFDTRDPNLKFVDLDGDGHADVLITEHEALTWYPSLAEEGFGTARRVRQSHDEEKGPKLVFADGTQSVYLADFSGDGLTDLVRIRNGEVCYWPNLGYGKFGAKVTMDDAPLFDRPDQFDQQRIRLADVDGSGVTDIIYLHSEGVRLYLNQSGNRWSQPRPLAVFPPTDSLSSTTMVDLLGNGTACLVWSSPLPGNARRQLRYVDLMGGQKPHLMIEVKNHLGAETRVHYAPSTRFYLADRDAGNPWLTRLPFPVHVVERVETLDRLSRNRFVTRYAYHHGYFDGVEREFRGFGMVEQQDTEEFAALNANDDFPNAANLDAASHVPPVITRTWFHTGVHLGRQRISNFYAGLLDGQDAGEYYREPGLSDAQARQLLLEDTVLPDGLTVEEEREACRALKGSMLRQEVYAADGTAEAEHPYTVSERNYTLRRLQPRGENPFAVFFVHPRETIDYHYERIPADPRIAHTLTLEVDDFGNVLKSAVVGYGRRQADLNLPLQSDRDKQTNKLVTYTENGFTNAIVAAADDYRAPLPCEARTYELTGYAPSGAAGRFRFSDFVQPGPGGLAHIFDGQLEYEEAATAGRQRRLIEHARTYYRPNDLGAAQNNALALLPLAQLESLALPGEAYKLAFTPGLLADVYGSRADGAMMGEGGYVHTEGDAQWWIPSGRVFFSPSANDAPAIESAIARDRFFSPHRFRDPFGNEATVGYDDYLLLVLQTRDAVGNIVTAGEFDAQNNLVNGNDYRVLQPAVMTDANGNRVRVAFDALGLVAGSAVMGKTTETLGDSLAGFQPDLDQNDLDAFFSDPRGPFAATLLGNATTRIIYDVTRYHREPDPTLKQPAYAATLARETHVGDLPANQVLKIQVSLVYSDGFGREMQKKIQAEPGRLDPDDLNQPIVNPRWAGSGWTIYNNKGKPVRQYEPFFDDTHDFRFGHQAGVSSVLFYDPLERVVATLHPNHSWEKVVFDPWRQTTSDVNDTVLTADPKTDPDAGDFFRRLPNAEYLPTWHTQRQGVALGLQEQAAASKAAIHAETPSVAHTDSLGRTVLAIAHNKFKYSDSPPADPPVEEFHRTRTDFDIEGNQRQVRDERLNSLNVVEERIVMRYDYDLLGNRIHQASMEAGERWTLNDVMGKPLRAWDSRSHVARTEYDALRRPLRAFVIGADPGDPNREFMTERLVYGEQHPENAQRNLRGKVFCHFDQAGVMSSELYDFKGNLLQASRRLAQEYKQTTAWDAADAVLPIDPAAQFNPGALEAAITPLLEAETFVSYTDYDALNRPIQITSPHTAGMPPSRIRPAYNDANLLERVDANLRNEQQNNQPVWTPFVANIDYDAKGQRRRIEYGNGVSANYDYDPLTFRLTSLQTLRGNERLQDLSYTYDPAGNVTAIRDDAQQTIYFNNLVVEPHAEYTYDAVYRLIEATGREHLGQAGGAPIPHSYNDAPRAGIDWSANDGNAMGTYLERYFYDAVGNLLSMQHRGSNPANPGWTRGYEYSEASLIEPAKQSNRLSRSPLASDPPSALKHFAYDEHGNMTRLPHLPLVQWDYRDQLQATAQQVVNSGTPETTWYVYDATGQRTRKVTESMAAAGQIPARMKERIYLGGFEIYREYESDGVAIKLERETLHVMDGQQRLALVENRTLGNDPSPPRLIRYQLANHLGSVSLELDQLAHIISYEEYTPFGSTAYQAVRSQTETPKRYRYTGMERDEESGLAYHSARYYLPWLGRWLSADPQGLIDGTNLYRYARNNPIKLNDPGGMDPPEESPPARVTPLLTDVSVARVAGSLQFHNLFSSDRSVSGSASLGVSARASFGLEVPALSLSTTGIAQASGVATIDTGAGSAGISLNGGLVLGNPSSGLNLTAVGRGQLRLPVPQQIGLSGLPQSLVLPGLAGATGEARVTGSFAAGSFQLADFRATASLQSGQLEGNLDATAFANLGRLHLGVTGRFGQGGALTLDSASLSATVGVPGFNLRANATGTANGQGGLNVNANADLRLFGLPSLHIEGAGAVSTTEASLAGTFSGAGPLYTSYITGDFNLSTRQGVGFNAAVFGLTYSPTVSVTDPSPPSAGMRAVAGEPSSPWEPGGLTVGASFFQYRQGNFNYISGGLMPDVGERILSNPRFGVTAQWHF